jgi:hypothetical protein
MIRRAAGCQIKVKVMFSATFLLRCLSPQLAQPGTPAMSALTSLFGRTADINPSDPSLPIYEYTT